LTEPADIPVFVLAGGLGTRFREETEFRPKPMILLGEQPIIWHIMRSYSQFGFRRFVICMGYKSESIRHYFLNFYAMNTDCTVNLASNQVFVHSVDHSCDWEVTLAYTGELTGTGGRVARAAARYLADVEHFAVTYGDGLTNADLAAEFAYHREHGRIGTVLAVNPPSRFGEFVVSGEEVIEFAEKPNLSDNWINGGYFFFRRGFVNFLRQEDECVLEREPLARLAREGELKIFKHDGFWACMDTQRDHDYLTQLWRTREAPWSSAWPTEAIIRSA
jgi:glucose-1-phosphate cytidylyltransferase